MLKFRRLQFRRIEDVLDTCRDSPSFLSDPFLAQTILSSFDWLQEHRGWTAFAITVMPNHVHALLQNFSGRDEHLSKDLGGLKSYTAQLANRFLERSGPFWQDENFDHWIRNEEKFNSTVEYIKNNPVKAGLCEHWDMWPWTKINLPENR